MWWRSVVLWRNLFKRLLWVGLYSRVKNWWLYGFIKIKNIVHHLRSNQHSHQEIIWSITNSLVKILSNFTVWKKKHQLSGKFMAICNLFKVLINALMSNIGGNNPVKSWLLYIHMMSVPTGVDVETIHHHTQFCWRRKISRYWKFLCLTGLS